MRTGRIARIAVACVATAGCVLAVAGCGSGGSPHSATAPTAGAPGAATAPTAGAPGAATAPTAGAPGAPGAPTAPTTGTPRAATAPTTGTSRAATANAEATKPPAQIVADAAAALGRAYGNEMEGRIVQNRQPFRVRLAAPSAGSLDLQLSQRGAIAQIIVSPAGSFIRGNNTFWASHLGARAHLLAGRWVAVPPSSAQTLASSLGHFAPATLARCLTEDHGSLTIAGHTTVGGQPAIVIRDAGNAPGASPGTLTVAASGPPYPLQATNTGSTRPGGHIDVCNDGKPTETIGTLTLSHFGSVPAIRPPTHVIRLGQTSST